MPAPKHPECRRRAVELGRVSKDSALGLASLGPWTAKRFSVMTSGS